MYQGFSYECVPINLFSYFSTKTCVAGTHKNRHNDTVLLNTKFYVKSDEQGNLYNFTLKNCAYLEYVVYSMKVCYTSVNRSPECTHNITGNSQKLWTAYLFRGKDEIFKSSILCKFITFVSSFMRQTLYFRVFR